MPQVVEVQILDLQESASPGEGGGYSVGRIRQDPSIGAWERPDDPHGFFRQVAPDVVTLFLPWMFHIPDHDPRLLNVEIIPLHIEQLFLPAGGEHRDSADDVHRIARWSPALDASEVIHQPVHLIYGRAPITLRALARQAKPARRLDRIVDR